MCSARRMLYRRMKPIRSIICSGNILKITLINIPYSYRKLMASKSSSLRTELELKEINRVYSILLVMFVDGDGGKESGKDDSKDGGKDGSEDGGKDGSKDGGKTG
ncbi:Hypothetical predicted protein [Octopus vulgaris]|uniref:Uncharacterized protein n=1 Tax=Octopus vulgaris TaxID=6645 RepID=A0AA36B0W9_OCTVU|nr:Hypothetical predicted protein [Octopus vulgaris]